MSSNQLIKGLSLKVGPLGENDRLLTILSEKDGIRRIAIPGGRKPKSSLAATSPLTFLELQIVGKSELKRVRQIKIIRSFSKLGENIETLSAAQALIELTLMLVGNNDPQPNILSTILIHLERLQETKEPQLNQTLILAKSIQSCIHLLALGGYCIPIHRCCYSGVNLIPPLGDWEWRCSFNPTDGFAIGSFPNAKIQLNPSELALLQRLLRPNLPFNKEGILLGPKKVWLKLLLILEHWISNNLPKKIYSLEMLREIIITSDLSRDNFDSKQKS